MSDSEQEEKDLRDSSEEEEEDEEDEVMDDLINDEEEEDPSSDDDDEKSAGKRSHDDDDVSSSVDEEDYELMREAGVSVPKKKKKQFKRIRRVADSDDEPEPDDGRTAIERDLFPERGVLDSDEDDEGPQPKPRQQDIDLNVDSEDDSESDNFIVDDDDQPIKKDKRKKYAHNDSAMNEAMETFGTHFDYNDIENDSENDYEEDDYDEDEDETGVARPQRKRAGAKPLREIFEPAELRRHHLTKEDGKVRDTDEPELYQLRLPPVTEADDEELVQEAHWIHKSAFSQPTLSIQEGNDPIAGRKSELTVPEMKFVLECIRNKKFVVSFMASHRREYFLSLSTNFDDTKDLWTIYKVDKLWCNFKARKTSILDSLRELQEFLTTYPDGHRFKEITDSNLKCVESASSFQEIEDCRINLSDSLRFLNEKKQKKKTQANEEDALNKKLSNFKISSSKSFYQRCLDQGLDEVKSKFGLTAEQLGENLREDYQRNNVVQCQRKPIEVAGEWNDKEKQYSSNEACLKAATRMFAIELASYPTVRQIIRRTYFENAVINVKPTELGMKEIDENHPCYATKFLKNKPVKTLLTEQFLEIIKAEQSKLLELKFSIEPTDKESDISVFQESLKALYYSDFSSIVTKEWNEQREKAIKICTTDMLFPCFEKQLRETLVKEAQDKIIKTCREKLRRWLNVAPYAPSSDCDDFEDFELRNGTRICGFSFAPDGDEPCFAAIIDSEGELIDHVRLPYINMRRRPERMNASERENNARDKQKFKQFIINRKPHVVALSAETIQTKYICQELATILDELRENDGLPLIPIEIVDNDISNVYMKSKRAHEEFPDFPPLLLQAISNARRLSDPLIEYAKLCNADNDILCIRFHSLQDDLPQDEFLEALHHEFITRTCAVGVDLNRAIAHPHTADLVQFLDGLGPRKAAHLLRSIKKLPGGKLTSRQQLVTELGMGPVVFMNCASFIKLDTVALSDEFPDEHITPLDSTRIHPESYGLAKKIAMDALDYDEDASEEATANAIEEIMENPEKLDDLDLNAFARELHRQDGGKKEFILQTIREELQFPYREHRESCKAPSQEEIFAMLTKETPTSFYNGKLITCQVTQIVRRKTNSDNTDRANPIRIDKTNLWQCPFCMRSDFVDLSVVWNHFDTNDCPGYAVGVKCKLDNGLSGFVPTKFLSDSEVSDPSQRVTPGQTIFARVMKIDTDKFSCDLTCRSSDLNDEAGKLKPARDLFYDENSEALMKRDLDRKAKRATRKPYCKRVIVHPAFENIDFKTCEKKLQLMEQGHAIIRPSSKGQNWLTVSWKVCDGINQHVNIEEKEKTNAFSLGHQLFIEHEPYEDLDEIIARYVQPMASYTRELLNYKYCIQLKDGIEEDQHLRNVLLMEKNQSNCFPYRFCPSRRIPGKFLLGYLPSTKPKIEYLGVTPRGYKFRGQYFKNLSMLIKWFKENWNRLPPPAYPSVTPGIGDSVRLTFPMSQ